MAYYSMNNCFSAECYDEEIFSKGVTYVWPETSAGTLATFTCVNNPKFSIPRMCNAGAIWEDFDREGCGVLASQLDALLQTIVSEIILVTVNLHVFIPYEIHFTLVAYKRNTGKIYGRLFCHHCTIFKKSCRSNSGKPEIDCRHIWKCCQFYY